MVELMFLILKDIPDILNYSDWLVQWNMRWAFPKRLAYGIFSKDEKN
ncbi:MAG: hypothetical protein IPM14_14090 [bacterium]|nr:hypothetical protein [bacterium]